MGVRHTSSYEGNFSSSGCVAEGVYLVTSIHVYISVTRRDIKRIIRTLRECAASTNGGTPKRLQLHTTHERKFRHDARTCNLYLTAAHEPYTTGSLCVCEGGGSAIVPKRCGGGERGRPPLPLSNCSFCANRHCVPSVWAGWGVAEGSLAGKNEGRHRVNSHSTPFVFVGSPRHPRPPPQTHYQSDVRRCFSPLWFFTIILMLGARRVELPGRRFVPLPLPWETGTRRPSAPSRYIGGGEEDGRIRSAPPPKGRALQLLL